MKVCVSYWRFDFEDMKELDKYHKWVDWSEEDQVYIGRCPDLITGIHGDDPVALYGELCAVIEDILVLPGLK